MGGFVRWFTVILVVVTVLGCGREFDDPTKPPPNLGPYDDPFVKVQRLITSTFIEIGEARIRDDGMLFFCTAVRGLNMVDASEPGNIFQPSRLTSSQGSGLYPKCQHVAFDGQYVYMSSRGDETQPLPFMTMFRVASGGWGELAHVVTQETTFEGIDARDGLLYAAMHERGLGVFQRNGLELELVGEVAGLDNAWGVRVHGSHAYVADGVGGIGVVDISDSTAPTLVAKLAVGGAAQHIELDAERNLAYLAAGKAGVVIVDIADPAQPRLVATIDTPGTALQAYPDGDKVYIADWNDARVYDVSTASAPRLVTKERIFLQDSFPRVLGIAAQDGHAFIGEWTGMYVYELRAETPTPEILIHQREAKFGQVAAGEQDAVALLVENQGTAPLDIWSLKTTSTDFTVSPSSLVLAPGEIQAVEVTFTAPDISPRLARLELTSDDPDESKRTVNLWANQGGLNVGDMAPDVIVSRDDGGTWQLSDHRGSVVLLAYFATF